MNANTAMKENDPKVIGSASDAEGASTRLFSSNTNSGRFGQPTLPGIGGDGGSAVEQVGRYKILDRLGQGGMATVYKAFDPGIDRAIAIKFLHPSLCLDENYRGRFLREAKAAGVLSHPNIVTVFDVGEIEGQPYIAMELIEGSTLSDVMADGAPLRPREVVEMGIQLARALDFAHSKGVVHRDIKPSNIVRIKGTREVKVTDFGIAHIGNAESTQHTKLGDVLGTPQYMSPEQAMGMGKKADSRSDLFSVGVVLFQLLTGQRPFEADSVATLMYRIAKEEPTPIPKLRADIPPSLRRVVDRCLKKQPEKRFQSGGELADALTAVLQEMDEETHEKSKSRLIPLRLKWTLLMAAVIAVTMAVTGAVVTKRQHAALMAQVIDYGAALSRFLAAESAVPVLSEDWVAIEIFVQEVMKSQDFQGISIVDHTGVVRASSVAATIGLPHQDPVGQQLVAHDKIVRVLRYTDDAGVPVLDFEAPITFQNRAIGHAHLTLPEQPLSAVARLTVLMMCALVVITVVAVVIATYIIADHFSKPIRVLRKAMREIAKGKLDRRIEQKRNDEFGLLYESFDEMAAALQKKAEEAEPPSGAA
ncbi:MAG: protein kinase [Betaproteobacteria bacterium]